jgi:hypothetical protein
VSARFFTDTGKDGKLRRIALKAQGLANAITEWSQERRAAREGVDVASRRAQERQQTKLQRIEDALTCAKRPFLESLVFGVTLHETDRVCVIRLIHIDALTHAICEREARTVKLDGDTTEHQCGAGGQVAPRTSGKPGIPRDDLPATSRTSSTSGAVGLIWTARARPDPR